MELEPSDLITVSKAREMLAITPYKMADLIKSGIIKTYPNLLDKRSKLISRKQIEELKGLLRREAA